MRWVVLLVGFVAGAATTWLLTVRRVTRTVSGGDERVDAGFDRADFDRADLERADVDDDDSDAADFGGVATTALVDTHGVGARWIPDAEDEDAVLHPHRNAPRAPGHRDAGSG